jgi:hypothetical protein
MKGSNILLLMLGFISLTVFVIPDTVSLFAGQHNYYDQAKCQRCHASEYDEIWSNSTARDAHIAAANNTNYTTYLAIGGKNYSRYEGTIYTVENEKWTWNGTWKNWTYDDNTSILVSLASINKNNNSGIDGSEICHLCHNASLTGKLGAHAITVRTCDDDWCHGNRNYVLNDPELFNTSDNTALNVGMVLNESDNLHRDFYLSQSNEPTGYVAGEPFINHTMGNTAGNYTSKGYWTCMGCHSKVQIEMMIDIVQRQFNHTDGQRRRY